MSTVLLASVGSKPPPLTVSTLPTTPLDGEIDVIDTGTTVKELSEVTELA